MKRLQVQAFTLVELLVALAIAGIILTIGVPSFRDLMRNNQSLSLSTALTASLRLARSEAIKRGERVAVCASAGAGETTCGATTDWRNGWIVFVDRNRNGIISNPADRLQVQQAPAQGSIIVAGQSFLAFDGMGFSATGSANFTLSASGCSGNHARQLGISNTGRVSVTATACP